MEVVEYIKEDGSNPYKEWFDSLNAQAAAKVTVARARLELGNTSSIKMRNKSWLLQGIIKTPSMNEYQENQHLLLHYLMKPSPCF
jgi:putative component of toxin-antitoxin plasmid stabilization module